MVAITTAQICLNGHVQSAGGFPFKQGEHCNKCGAECIDECPGARRLYVGAVALHELGRLRPSLYSATNAVALPLDGRSSGKQPRNCSTTTTSSRSKSARSCGDFAVRDEPTLSRTWFPRRKSSSRSESPKHFPRRGVLLRTSWRSWVRRC